MEFKTKNGTKISFNEISVLELCKLKDVLNKCTEHNDGKFVYTAPFECIYRWLSTCISGFTDELFLSLSEEERPEIFLKMQEYYMLGEEKASK